MKKILPALFLIVLPILLFNKALLGENVIAVGDFSGSDLLDLHYPFKYNLAASIQMWRFPIWESNLAMGFPVIAEGQTGVFYPINLILSFFEPAVAINLSVVIAILIASFSSFYYLRLVGMARSAALFGAVSFSFSSFFITRVKHLNLINVASLFPLLLITAEYYFQIRKIKYAIWSGVVIALMFFAGHPQMTLYSVLVLGIYALFKSYSAKVRVKTALVRFSGFFFISLFVGVLLAAVQIIPTIEFSKFSSRLDINQALTADFPYQPTNLITLFSPYHFGNPAEGTYSSDIKTQGVFWENSLYIGIGPIILAIYWIVRSAFKRKLSPYTKFFIFLSLISFLIMLGTRTPVIFFLVKFIPFFSLFRFPMRFSLFFIFSLSFLGAKAYEHFLKIKGNKFKNIFALTFIATLIIDLFIFANSYIGYFPIDRVRTRPEFLKVLEKDSDLYRIYSITQYQKSPYLDYGWKNNIEPLLAIREAIPPNNNLLYGIDSFTDRGWFEGGLSIKRRNELESYVLLGAYRNYELIAKVLGMFNVKYLVSFLDSPGAGVDQIKENNLGSEFENTLKLYKNEKVLKRAYYVPGAEVIEHKDEFFGVISSPDFDPEKTVVIEDAVVTEGDFVGNINDFLTRNSVEINSYGDTEVILEANVADSGFLVLSDVNYPGWKVTINGAPGRILNANYVVRAIELKPGKHSIRFYYDPVSIKIGASLSVLSILFIILMPFLKNTVLRFKH